MSITGIVAEYNPFHNGHKYQIEKAKELTGADYAVVVMNGDFVQRGTPAVTDKFTRTKMALSGGADLVFELPVRYGTASAEAFAAGAVSLLTNLGFTDTLCFGSECGDLSLLSMLADILSQEPAPYRDSLKAYLKQGLSFPLARTKALTGYLSENAAGAQYDGNAVSACLSSPNDILGLEYLKALNRQKSGIRPFTVKRIQSGYHEADLRNGISSATAIRTDYQKHGSLNRLKEAVPAEVFQLLEQSELKSFPVTAQDFSSLLFYKLLMEKETGFSRYSDVSDELSHRIANTCTVYTDFEDYAAGLKSRQLTRTRINRCLLHILLDIHSFKTESVISQLITPYARLLGLKRSASHLLRSPGFSPSVPCITKMADAKKKLTQYGTLLFEEDIRSSDLYHLVLFQKYGIRIPSDYKMSPVIVP